MGVCGGWGWVGRWGGGGGGDWGFFLGVFFGRRSAHCLSPSLPLSQSLRLRLSIFDAAKAISSPLRVPQTSLNVSYATFLVAQSTVERN